MIKVLLVLALSVSCTMMRDRGVHKKDLIIWDLDRTYKAKNINDSIDILYKTCFSEKDRKYDFWEPLRVEFKKKFGIELIGLSKAESRSFYITDSSLFVANEVCLHIKGNPVTEKVFKTEFSGSLEIHDPNHHVH